MMSEVSQRSSVGQGRPPQRPQKYGGGESSRGFQDMDYGGGDDDDDDDDYDARFDEDNQAASNNRGVINVNANARSLLEDSYHAGDDDDDDDEDDDDNDDDNADDDDDDDDVVVACEQSRVVNSGHLKEPL